MIKGQAPTLSAGIAAGTATRAVAQAGRVRLVPFTDLSSADLAAWQALGEAALAGPANIFARPWVLIAGLRHVATEPVTIAMVDDGSGNLIGVIPLILAGRLGRVPLTHWRLWNHPNSFCAPLLIRAGQEQAFWALLLRGLAAAPDTGRACALMLTSLPLDARAGLGESMIVVEQGWRAAITDGEPLGDYWGRHVRAKKRKELRRQAARLAELGALTVSELAPGDDAGPWIAEFLALERLGWKGAAGSALASSPGTAAYFGAVVADAHARDALCFLSLRLDGRALAMLVTLFDGDAAFSFKTAYDEEFARFSPGVLIQQDNLAVLARRAIRSADSCAAPDHPMIDSIWADRRGMITGIVTLPGIRNRIIITAYRTALAGWRAVKPLMGKA